MLHAAVALSIILGFASTEFLGLLTGGIVSAGYIAFYLEQPFRVISTLVLSVATCLIVEFLQRHLILFGRRRFMITVLISIIISALWESSYFYFSFINQDLRIIGYIIPGLIANDMEKQGIVRTLLMLIIVSAIIWLFLHLRILS